MIAAISRPAGIRWRMRLYLHRASPACSALRPARRRVTLVGALRHRAHLRPRAQAALVHAGASRTLNSRHITGHAVDVAAIIDGAIRWDWPLYPRIAEAIKAAAKARGVALIWGGDWPRLRDGPHFELDRTVFP